MFDVCIGNPPYNETKGGTKNVDIWPCFIEAATDIADASCLIHPGRWVVPKKNMEKVRDMMVENGLKKFDYYPNADMVFNNVSIDGGVTITFFSSQEKNKISYRLNGTENGVYTKDTKLLSKYEIEAKEKIWKRNNISIEHRIFGNIGCLGGSEFGYKKHDRNQIDHIVESQEKLEIPVRIWCNTGFGRGTRFDWHYIDFKELKNPPEAIFSSRKIMIDKKGHALTHGKGNIINNIPQIVDKMSTASGDVLFVFPEHDTDYDLQLIKSLFMTKTARFLMSITQKDLYVRGFENIPDYISFIPMLNGELFTDQWFYKTFDFSDDLIEHIEKMVSPKKDSTEELNPYMNPNIAL